jgi:hypothetical protein
MEIWKMPQTAKKKTPLSLGQRVWRRIIGERSWTRQNGSFRDREQAGLLDRTNYAYGMLRAADTAAYFGKSSVSVCEFGVARGWGLMNMAKLADMISAETGVDIRVFGFDTGKGLPPPTSYKDHPELWSAGDFLMDDPEELRKRLGNRTTLVLGDIADTVDAFRESLTSDSPLGFVSIDVDIYSGTVSALRALQGPCDKYLPAISFYLDDVASYFNNFASGELCAVAEHNASFPHRPIDIDRSLPGLRTDPDQGWNKHMYVCHILDHPARTSPPQRPPLNLVEHLHHMGPLR